MTYLAPGIPLGFYETVTRSIARALGEPVELMADSRFSGPPRGEPNPLATGAADLAFACGPSYLRLAGEVQLVPAAPVFDDPRGGGAPVYFAEVLTVAGRAERTLRELATGRVAFNDPESLSGCLSILGHLGPDVAIGQERWSGSHEASVAMLLAGDADVCAVDSVVWRRLAAERPGLTRRLRVVEALGPFPIQPVLASRALPVATVDRIAAALLGPGPGEIGTFGASGFAPVDDAHYRPLAAAYRPGP